MYNKAMDLEFQIGSNKVKLETEKGTFRFMVGETSFPIDKDTLKEVDRFIRDHLEKKNDIEFSHTSPIFIPLKEVFGEPFGYTSGVSFRKEFLEPFIDKRELNQIIVDMRNIEGIYSVQFLQGAFGDLYHKYGKERCNTVLTLVYPENDSKIKEIIQMLVKS